MQMSGGVRIEATHMDDFANETGCGHMPYLKAVAELMKKQYCEPARCL
jgi:hypothetical protein